MPWLSTNASGKIGAKLESIMNSNKYLHVLFLTLGVALAGATMAAFASQVVVDDRSYKAFSQLDTVVRQRADSFYTAVAVAVAAKASTPDPAAATPGSYTYTNVAATISMAARQANKKDIHQFRVLFSITGLVGSVGVVVGAFFLWLHFFIRLFPGAEFHFGGNGMVKLCRRMMHIGSHMLMGALLFTAAFHALDTLNIGHTFPLDAKAGVRAVFESDTGMHAVARGLVMSNHQIMMATAPATKTQKWSKEISTLLFPNKATTSGANYFGLVAIIYLFVHGGLADVAMSLENGLAEGLERGTKTLGSDIAMTSVTGGLAGRRYPAAHAVTVRTGHKSHH